MLNLTAIYYQFLSNYEKAKIYAQKVLDINERNGNALIIMGDVNDKQDNLSESIKYYQLSANIEPFGVNSNYKLGKIYLK